MKYIDLNHLVENKQNLIQQWNDPKKPFKYLVGESFFSAEKANEIALSYPNIFQGNWDGTTYINQKNKFTKTQFTEEESVLQTVFKELNSSEFLKIVEEITGIQELIADDELFGGGLHQSTNGAFLDVHVDFNFHPKTKTHRRMNLIIYMNENWSSLYNGYLELWDMEKKIQLENIAPLFNRFVIFETNEVSFHGHPKKLKTPEGISRKSIAVYYYTKDRTNISEGHNTIYVNTEGYIGKMKNFISGMKALKERVFKK